MIAYAILPIVFFVAQPETPEYFVLRDGIPNCRRQFDVEKKGRVVFMGGSITTMPGWRDLTCKFLRDRFPETDFDFVDAGIGGTNSTLGALRLEEDVFGHGPVDLLFLEFAVNDSGDSGPDNRRSRAIEGILRHAFRLNPRLDVIMQYFVDREKVTTIREGKRPDVIAEHDAVAAHYGIPALDLAQEMTRRLDAGAFAWEQFARDSCHPLPFGHEQYLGCIAAFLDKVWGTPLDPAAPPGDRDLPAPMDPLNYSHGRFVPAQTARILDGWTYLPAWDTEKKCNYGGAVAVLAAESPGATFGLDFDGSFAAIYAIAGMDAGMLEIEVDGGPARTLDLFDHYCEQFHRPVCRTLAEELPLGKHVLTVRVASQNNPKSRGHAARILKIGLS